MRLTDEMRLIIDIDREATEEEWMDISRALHDALNGAQYYHYFSYPYTRYPTASHILDVTFEQEWPPSVFEEVEDIVAAALADVGYRGHVYDNVTGNFTAIRSKDEMLEENEIFEEDEEIQEEES